MPADEIDGADRIESGDLGDAAVRPAEVLAPRGAEHARAASASARAFLGRAVAAELAGGEIAEADTPAFRGVPRDRAAEADFNVVRVRTKHNQVDSHSSTL